MIDERHITIAREAAAAALLERSYVTRNTTVHRRMTRIRAGHGDDYAEVQSALRALRLAGDLIGGSA